MTRLKIKKKKRRLNSAARLSILSVERGMHTLYIPNMQAEKLTHTNNSEPREKMNRLPCDPHGGQTNYTQSFKSCDTTKRLCHEGLVRKQHPRKFPC